MEQIQKTDGSDKDSLMCGIKKRCISERTLALSVIISLLAGTALVYIWYEPFVYGSKRILNGRIYELEAQRDQVLQQRKILKIELDVCREELGGSSEEEKGTVGEEAETDE